MCPPSRKLLQWNRTLIDKEKEQSTLQLQFINIPLATLFIYVVIVRPPGLPCPVMRVHEIGILSKILSATGGKWIILQKDVPVSNLVSLT